MQGEVVPESERRRERQIGFAETELEQSGIRLNLRPLLDQWQPMITLSRLGDGRVRFSSPIRSRLLCRPTMALFFA